MNQQSLGRNNGPDAVAGAAANTNNGTSMDRSLKAGEAVAGPFTIRDIAVFGATFILLVASLLPMFDGEYNLWNLNNLFFLGLGIVLPVTVAALFAARRLAPATKLRIGSLSIDQFASVVASFAAAFFFLSVAATYEPVLLVGLVGALVLLAVTVLGRFLPYISADFEGRPEIPAHVVAREAAVPVQKPRAPKQPKTESGSGASGPKAAFGAGLFSGAGAGSSAVDTGPSAHHGSTGHHQPTRHHEPVAHHEPERHQPAPQQNPSHHAPTAATPVSTAPEASDWSAAGDAGPATQASDVVSPAQVPAAGATPDSEISGTRGRDARSGEGATAGGQETEPARTTWEPPAATAVHQQVSTDSPIGATVDPSTRPDESDDQPVHEAFWFAVAQHRTAFDPRTGAPAFVIEPGGWVLALEDRGDEFLVQHTDGRLGVLRDLSNIERG